ncbi:dTDP-4-dehydrorhamnose reductase [Myxococcota bacterium]|nr:dTDP-4-dehydrorhamnose reductase [Myxococcota bacterium]
MAPTVGLCPDWDVIVRWLVTGAEGQLGRCLVARIQGNSGERLAGAFTRADLDLSDKEKVHRLRETVLDQVDVVVNAAALTAVDRCESESTQAFAVNAEGPAFLGEACRDSGTALIHISTDYVFDGKASRPYSEADSRNPRSVYGRSKAEGEIRLLELMPEALVVRTSWLFGPGRNFVVAIREQAEKRRRGEATGPLRVVDDQQGTPTYAADLAEGLCQLGRHLAGDEKSIAVVEGSAPRGLMHLANSGQTSWFSFAREILDRSGFSEVQIEPSKTAELNLPAPRPAYSVLDCSRAKSFGIRLRSWQEALAAYLDSEWGETALGGRM